MIKNGKGGGNTKTGLIFEGQTDLSTFFNNQRDYKVENDNVYYKKELVAKIFKKYKFYNIFFKRIKYRLEEIYF